MSTAAAISILTHAVRTIASGSIVAVDRTTGVATRVPTHANAHGAFVDTCRWLCEGLGFEGERQVFECGAAALITDDGFCCEQGHEHLTLEAQDRLNVAYVDTDEMAAIRTGAWVPGFTPLEI